MTTEFTFGFFPKAFLSVMIHVVVFKVDIDKAQPPKAAVEAIAAETINSWPARLSIIHSKLQQ